MAFPQTKSSVLASLNAEEQIQLSELYESELGFTKVIQMLIDAKKPLVGHNPQYDVAFMYEQFIAPLPASFIEFCQEWRKFFPLIYDTKCIFAQFQSGTFKDGIRSYLNKIFEAIEGEKQFYSNLVIKFDQEKAIEFAIENEQHHDAAYDAYMTGYIFAMMTKRLEIEVILTQAIQKKAEEENKSS